LVVNKLRGTFNAVAVKAPGFGDRRKAMLEDIAVLTGGEVITEDLGLDLKSTQITQLGRAAKVVVSKDNTTTVEGYGNPAAVEEGIVSGGGTALINVYNKVAELNLDGDEETGASIVLRALEEPLRQIAENAGLEGSIVVERLKGEKVGVGFDAAKGEWVNMIEAGIVDPTKVTRSALQHAASVAAMFLTTETVVADIPEEGGGGMPDMGGMGGMGGGMPGMM